MRRSLQEQKVKGRNVFLRSFQDGFADARFLLPLDGTSEVLDLGCGYGGLSVPMARAFGRVVAADATFERAKLVSLRAEHEGLKNLVAVHANALALPFAPASFDAIVMNGVLEWVGEWDPSRHPRRVQLDVLRICRDLLRPGGVLFVAIENRWGLELVYRRKDHNKLYWTSFLPRMAADIVTRVLKKKSYRTYTYGYAALTGLITEAGFGQTQTYCPWPRYQDPDYIVQYGDERAFEYFRTVHLSSKNRFEAAAFAGLRRVGLHWTFAPAWIVLAHKP